MTKACHLPAHKLSHPKLAWAEGGDYTYLILWWLVSGEDVCRFVVCSGFLWRQRNFSDVLLCVSKSFHKDTLQHLSEEVQEPFRLRHDRRNSFWSMITHFVSRSSSSFSLSFSTLSNSRYCSIIPSKSTRACRWFSSFSSCRFSRTSISILESLVRFSNTWQNSVIAFLSLITYNYTQYISKGLLHRPSLGYSVPLLLSPVELFSLPLQSTSLLESFALPHAPSHSPYFLDLSMIVTRKITVKEII